MTNEEKNILLDACKSVGLTINEVNNIAETTVYTDYRFELPESILKTISKSNEPEADLIDYLHDTYSDACWEEKAGIIDDIMENDRSLDVLIDKYGSDTVREQLEDIICVDVPYHEALDYDMLVNIMVDTGDANCDFTCNNWGPHYLAETYHNEPSICDDSSLLWLCEQQGANKTLVKMAIKEKGKAGRFFDSVYDELNNSSSSMNILTFCVLMTVKQYIELRDAMDIEKDRNNSYYANKRKGRGYIWLSKDTTCGLVDPWSGGGSLLEIALDSKVKLPIRYIYKAEQDGSTGYGIRDIYGCGRGIWSGSVDSIHSMKVKKGE
jgi:hypothetical protein